MDLIDQAFGIHGTALALRSARLDLLASNIANAATPGYKARDLDFRAALNAVALNGATSNGATGAGLDSTGSTAAAMASAVRFRVPMATSLDGNTVELATEQTQFAQNAVQYRTTLAFLGARIGGIMQALKGE